ncbi:MAG: SpoIIE family protein phosphatase [Alphaproteobacteria bacterium]|nr:SpoIIE family protein phosphatase [Alphaproteobacteria bacterium]
MTSANSSLGRIKAYSSQMANQTDQAAKTIVEQLELIDNPSDELLFSLSKAALKVANSKNDSITTMWIYTLPKEGQDSGVLYYNSVKPDGTITTINIDERLMQFVSNWKDEALATGRAVWSEPYQIENKGVIYYTSMLSVPFKFKGSDEWNGLVVACLNLQKIVDLVDNIKFYGDGKMQLISKKGLYIVHPSKLFRMNTTIFENSKMFNLPILTKIGEDLAAGKSGEEVLNSEKKIGTDIVFLYDTIPTLDWGVILTYSWKKLYQPLKTFQRNLLICIISGLFVLIFLIHWICRFSTRPLVRLSQAAEHYGKGDFEYDIPNIKSADEIGKLSEAFNQMRENLINHIDKEKENAAEQQRQASEMEIAKSIQTSSLPKKFPNDPRFKIVASMQAAKHIGGDFYDCFFIDDSHFAFLIADVSGKGVPAALFMMTAKTTINNVARSGNFKSYADIYTQANNDLCKNNITNMFATSLLAILNINTGDLDIVNAGHNPPLIKTNDGYKYLETEKNLMLGGMSGIDFNAEHIKLAPGDKFFIYTDGVTEAENPELVLYGEEQLLNFLNKIAFVSVEDTISLVRQDVERHANGANQSDDITMVVVEYRGNENSKKEDVIETPLNEVENKEDAKEDDEDNVLSSKSKTDSLSAALAALSTKAKEENKTNLENEEI